MTEVNRWLDGIASHPWVVAAYPLSIVLLGWAICYPIAREFRYYGRHRVVGRRGRHRD